MLTSVVAVLAGFTPADPRPRARIGESARPPAAVRSAPLRSSRRWRRRRRRAWAIGWSRRTVGSSRAATRRSTVRPVRSISNRPIVGMAPTPSGRRLLDRRVRRRDLRVRRRRRSTARPAAIHLNQPIVGMAATPSGRGYWFVARDGGIFAFGDAAFYGSTGGDPPEPADRRDGGDAVGSRLLAGRVATAGSSRSATPQFYGSTGGIHLNQPIVGMAATPTRARLLARGLATAAIFAFGDAGFYGSTGGITLEPADRRHGGDAVGRGLLVRRRRRRRLLLRRRADSSARPERSVSTSRSSGWPRRSLSP